MAWTGVLARGSEDVRDDIVSVDTIDQSGPIVVDEPAGHLGPMPGALAVVFLQAPEKRQVSWDHLLDPSGLHLPETPPTHVTSGGRPGPMMGNIKDREAKTAAHLPGDRKLLVLHHHCGICL